MRRGHRLFRDQGLRVCAKEGPAMGGCGGRCVRILESAVFVRRAAALKSVNWQPMRSSMAGKRGYFRRTAWRVGATSSTAASIGCAAWCASTIGRLQLWRIRKNYPETALGCTVTDLLIGDSVRRSRRQVWGPMESLYRPGKSRIQEWNEGISSDEGPRIRRTN